MAANGERLRWGVLGTAGIAEAFVRGVRKGAAGTVAAVAGRDLARAEGWATRHGVPQAFGSYDEMLRSGAVDLVYNPLPNSLHAQWTIRALDAGLPVLCEKPLTTNAAEAVAVAEAARRAGLPVAEAFMYRFHPLYDRVLRTIRAGAIGEVTMVHARFTFRLDDFGEHPASAEFAGGALRDVGCYGVDLARLVTGNEPTRAFAIRRGTEVDLSLAGMLEFPGGVLAQVECSVESEEHHGAEILGTGGSIVIASPWHPGEERASFVLRRGGVEETIGTPGGDGYHLEAEDFARARRAKTPPRWGIDHAVAGIKALDALLESARTGEAVALNGRDTR
jgi:predicted dehydrogenase